MPPGRRAFTRPKLTQREKALASGWFFDREERDGLRTRPEPEIAVNDHPSFLSASIPPELVETFAALLCDSDGADAETLMDDLCAGGVGPDSIMLDLLAPAARLLGDQWCRDEANFLDVTLGLGRIHRLLRRLQMPQDRIIPRGSVLLVPVPGEQHVLGLRIVQEFLLRAGWHVHLGYAQDADAIRRLLAGGAYDIVGLSISGERLLPVLRSVISGIRSLSGNHDIRIMVGGAIFLNRELGDLGIAADAIIRDAQAAVDQANAWFGLVGAE